MPPSPPPPPVGGPGGGGPPGGAPGSGGGNGKVIAIVVVLLAILGVGAFLLLSGGDDDDDDVATEQDEDDDEDENDDDEDTTTTEAEEDEETTTTAAEDEETTTTAVDDTVPGDPGELTFTQISDDTGTLVVEVPDTWTDVDGAPLGANSPNVQASTDLAAFRQGLGASGLSFTLLEQQNVDPDATLDFLTASHLEACEEQPREDYTDGVFTGRVQQLLNCGPQAAALIVIVATNDAGQSVEVSTVIVPPDPLEEIERRIIETFNIAG